MTTKKPKLFSNRSSSRQFLLYKTEAKPEKKKTSDTQSLATDTLLKSFPDMLSGQAFIDYASAQIESSATFDAMVIRIDALTQNNDAPDHHHAANLQIDIAQSIDGLCDSENGIWGQLKPDTYGCFFCRDDRALALDLAHKIQNNLAVRRKETISIGIASFPTGNYEKNQILDNAYKALDHAAFFGPHSVVAFDSVSLNISGDKLYQKGDIQDAIEEFKAAIRLDPSNVNVHNSLGVCYGTLKSYEKALEEFKEAIRLDPEEAMALYNAGLANMLLGKNDRALEYFLDADRKEEDIFEVALHIGKIYLEFKKPDQGKSYLEKASKIRPESGLAFRYLGECCIAMNMLDEAILAYKTAIRKNPNDADSLSALGYLFDLQGENPEITTIFCQQSVDISPDNGLFRYRLGNLYLKRNQLDDALEQLKKADELGHDAKELIQKINSLMADSN
ncbi:MAG: tetratricopeptide repeat protein [Desulfobacterales bacterium]|nr:MAG: tetratricopeptide repeat protein [Desulfobacterales bacterium]